MKLKGLVKAKYGEQLHGRDWIKRIEPEDRAALVAQCHEAAQHGHIGGVKRAQAAQRDNRGRFVGRDGSNKRSGQDPRAGTCNDEILWG
jgi:hypothetical protein